MPERQVYWLRDFERPDVDVYLREVAEFGVKEVFVGGYAIAEIRPGAQVSAAALAQAGRMKSRGEYYILIPRTPAGVS